MRLMGSPLQRQASHPHNNHCLVNYFRFTNVRHRKWSLTQYLIQTNVYLSFFNHAPQQLKDNFHILCSESDYSYNSNLLAINNSVLLHHSTYACHANCLHQTSITLFPLAAEGRQSTLHWPFTEHVDWFHSKSLYSFNKKYNFGNVGEAKERTKRTV